MGDVVYVGLGLLLAGSALVLLVATGLRFSRSLLAGTLPEHVVGLLDQMLLIVMIVEILYTVQVFGNIYWRPNLFSSLV